MQVCLNCHNPHIGPEEKTCPKCGAYLPSLLQHTLPPETQLRNGAYHIDHALDTGGFGTIYRAFHISLDCPVAIKEFYPRAYGMREKSGVVSVASDRKRTFEAERNQFLQEGRILAELNHRGVVNVLDLFEERNTAYLVMELLKGQTLRQRLDQQPEGLKPELVRKIVRQLVITLEMLHRRKPPIYHLDIKPENVFLASSDRAVLIDFGAARLGRDGYVVPQYDLLYAPPELTSKDSNVGPQSDLFELAMTAYELLTGQRPPPAAYRSKDWHATDLEGPWRSALERALQLSKDKRPSGVLSWWVNTMGAGLPPFFKDKIDIFLDPEEAQVLLEKRLAERHEEYNELSLTNSRLREENARLKRKAASNADTREKSEKDESEVKLQETTAQKRELEEKLRVKTNEANTLKSQQQKLEHELQGSKNQQQKLERALQESKDQQQKLEQNAVEQKKLEENFQEKANEANTLKHEKENLERALQETENQRQNIANDFIELRQELKRLQSTLTEVKPSQGNPLYIYRQHTTPMRFLAWSPDGTRILSIGSIIHIWDVSSGASITPYEEHIPKNYPFHLVRSVVWSPDSTQIALGAFGEVHILDVNKGFIRVGYKDCFFDVNRARGEMNASEFVKLLQTSPHPLTWSPNGACIASVCNTATIQVWNSTTGMLLASHDPRFSSGSFSALKWSPHSGYLASVLNGIYIIIWEPSSWRRISVHTTASSNFAWSPDSRYIASISGDSIQIWDVTGYDWQQNNNALVYRDASSTIADVSWSPDSRYIASAHGHTIQIRAATTGAHIYTYRGHTDEVNAVVWSPDSTRIASASPDGTVHVWQAV
jgi:serine/threonine protein kinase